MPPGRVLLKISSMLGKNAGAHQLRRPNLSAPKSTTGAFGRVFRLISAILPSRNLNGRTWVGEPKQDRYGAERDDMLLIHRAERTDRLVDALSALLEHPLDDPFAAEVVGVPSRGVERWLAQRLSHRLGTGRGKDGVCANVVFPSLSDLVEQVSTLGRD